MSTLLHRRNTVRNVNELVASAPTTSSQLTNDHRASLSARFRAVNTSTHRRLDAWMVEQAGKPYDPFHWTPQIARRVLGTNALRRINARNDLSISQAVRDELADHLLRSTAGYTQSGSLSYWLSGLSHASLGLVCAEAVTWSTTTYEVLQGLEHPWQLAQSDAYYDVSAARTSLRGRRDIVIKNDDQRVVLRLRAGSPGKSSGPGLRCDLTIDALASPTGTAASRFIGVWPDAGVCLSVDGTMADLRAGARDLVRTAVVQQRGQMLKAA
jgi:hypothetical protein